MERNADFLDQAGEATQMLIEAQEREVRRRNAPEQVQNEDGSWPHECCVLCGDDLPEARLALGRVRCVVCQDKLERKQRGLFTL